MSEYGYAISWFTLSPLAVVTDVLGIIVITHYFPFFHGTDVTLISLMVSMAGNAMFVLTIPAYLEINGKQWTPTLCYGFVWCVLTIRVAQLLSLMVLSIHWSTLLKLSAQNKRYVSTKYLKFTVAFVWVFSAIFGILPILGVASADFNSLNSCKFLAFNLGIGYALFFLIFNTVALFVSILCCCDSMMLIKHVKNIAGSKYQTGRFQLPDRRSDIPIHAGSSMAERYHRLQFAWDLSKFAMVFVLFASTINHLPCTIIQALQLFTKTDRRTLEVISLYLVAVEAVLMPHMLWLLSRRYRHALTYQWKVYVLRNKDIEEDEPTACTLQSYISRERDRISLAPSRPASVIGYSAPGTLRSVKSETMGRPTLQMNSQSSASPVTARKDLSRVTTVTPTPPTNGVIKGEVYVERPPSLYDERPIDVKTLEISSIDRRGYVSDSNLPSPVGKKELYQPEIKRSASSASRQNWKDQMRRKHLPPIFINEGYEPGDKSPSTEETKVKTVFKEGGVIQSNRSAMNYYMSSDYHPDCLTDSLPRNRIKHAPSTESESGEVYRNEDIEEVLNTSILSRQAYNSGSFSDHAGGLRTFKASPERPKMGVGVQKGIYSTFEDLSKMDMRHEHEIEFNNDSIQLDEISDEYNNSISTQAVSKDFDSLGFRTDHKNLSSFKPDDSGFRHTLPRHIRPETGNVRVATTSFGCKVTEVDEPREYATSKCVPQEIEALAKMRVDQNNYGKFDLERHQSSAPVQKQDSGRSFTVVFDKRDNSIDDENASSNSSGSVTISPYQEGGRRRPWMEEAELQNDDHSQIGEPLVLDSDTETLRESQDSMDFRLGLNYETRYPGSFRSELSTPVSSIFDEETDRGFEDALDLHINSGGTVYGGVGLCFESIKEEPEDIASSGSNPFLNNDNDEDVFRTQAVISRSSKSNSRTSSCTSVGENTYLTNQSTPPVISPIPFQEKVSAPAIVTTDADLDFADSGFTSGYEKGNASDSSGQHEVSSKDHTSPWPDDSLENKHTDMSFESNFCATSNISSYGVFSSPLVSKTYDKSFGNHVGSPKTEFSVTGPKPSSTSPVFEGRKPFHKAIEAIKINTRPTPQRVRSFERYSSPVPERKLPKRGHSFETDRSDVKPAYF